MRPTSYQSEDLDRLLRKHKIATLDDLKAVLGTDVDSTVFRKLNELAYRTSYSHRGSYYTLDEIAQFDRKGLWSVALSVVLEVRDVACDGKSVGRGL